MEQADPRLLSQLVQAGTEPLVLADLGFSNIQLVQQDLYRLEQYGLEFSCLDDNICQLKQPLDLLQPEQIRAQISQPEAARIGRFKYHPFIDSTNTYLLHKQARDSQASICLTEFQTAGRGRFGRHWFAPFACGLCLSFAWSFQIRREFMQLISFLPSVALVRVLKANGLKEAGVKWPNDLICAGKKLAGSLIELPPRHADQQNVIMGIGLNIYQHQNLFDQVQQGWTSLDQWLDPMPSRSQICSQLITELIRLVGTVEQEGLAAIREEWRGYDQYYNQPVEFLIGDTYQQGISRGINDDGTLRLEIDHQLQTFASGEISLRAAS